MCLLVYNKINISYEQKEYNWKDLIEGHFIHPV